MTIIIIVVASWIDNGLLLAVGVGAVVACEGNRELATADKDCWAAPVIDMHRGPSWSISVLS